MILNFDRIAKNFEAWAMRHGGPWYAARAPQSNPWPSKAKRRNARLMRRQIRRETQLERCFL